MLSANPLRERDDLGGVAIVQRANTALRQLAHIGSGHPVDELKIAGLEAQFHAIAVDPQRGRGVNPNNSSVRHARLLETPAPDCQQKLTLAMRFRTAAKSLVGLPGVSQ